MAAGRFREDLFYRLNVIPLELPPLRARGKDVQLIAEQFMARFGKEEGRELTALSEESRAALYEHPWPGNVRELQNTVRRAVVVGSGPTLDLALQRNPGASVQQVALAGHAGPDVTMPSPLDADRQPARHDVWEGMTLDQIERMAIHAAIKRCDGNITKAAKTLDVSPSTVYRKLEKWGGSDRLSGRGFAILLQLAGNRVRGSLARAPACSPF
ncbi:helix-turn-helix domain-containing protein [Citromicrobium bathyomarinum]|uniref:helix-turn-helix domain-containing protein n=1 Tax=Citromicrobium bathyomarinum TaxID=72174 RepID=UPI001E4A8F8F